MFYASPHWSWPVKPSLSCLRVLENEIIYTEAKHKKKKRKSILTLIKSSFFLSKPSSRDIAFFGGFVAVRSQAGKQACSNQHSKFCDLEH